MNGPHAWATPDHEHVFLGEGHDRNARRTWSVIALCSVAMVVEITGGLRFGSLALVADALHMSTHAAAMLIAAAAYAYARRHARDGRFSFGTGKVGDLAGFSSALVLAMIALLIGYEAIERLVHPVRIDFDEAIAIACLGLLVNLASAWLLGGGEHDQAHDHDHDHDHHRARGGPHAHPRRADALHRDHNMRAAFAHVAADAAVSVLAVLGLAAGKFYGLVFMDPVTGLVGALVIANWSFGLLRDTGAILLDMSPDGQLARDITALVESRGDDVCDLHLWRLGPGHLGAIVAVRSHDPARDCAYYRALFGRIEPLSHVTVEVRGQHARRAA